MNTTTHFLNRLTGFWLRLAQVGWIIITITTTSLFLAGIPFALTAFSVGSFITPETMTALQVQGISPQQYALFTVANLLTSGLIWLTVGILIFVRKSTEVSGLIVSFALVTFGTNNTLRGALVEAVPALSLLHQILSAISWVSLALFFVLFPNGRFVPRWLRWLVLGVALLFFLPIMGLNIIPEAVGGLFFLSFWVIFLLAQIYRYLQVSSFEERQQTKWVFLGLVLLFATLIPLFIFSLFNQEVFNSPYVLIMGNSITVVIPLCIGIAVLRSHLWDIDIIIRRTLQYTLLTGLLALTYFGGVVILQGILGPLTGSESSPLVTVITTLGIAALFTPLRHRVQDFIDRRFFRKKYDAEKTLANFAVIARDEVDMDKLTAALLEVVEETMQPVKVSLWLKKTPGNRMSKKEET